MDYKKLLNDDEVVKESFSWTQRTYNDGEQNCGLYITNKSILYLSASGLSFKVATKNIVLIETVKQSGTNGIWYMIRITPSFQAKTNLDINFDEKYKDIYEKIASELYRLIG